jgi:hypothetical protein
MSDPDLGRFNDVDLSDETRREISEFVERSDHYDSVEEFIEDAVNYQIEFFQRTADATQQPITRTNSVVLRLLATIDHALAGLHRKLLDITRRYVALLFQSRDQLATESPSRSRTTAAEKMKLYSRRDTSNTANRTYRQRTAEMRDLLENEGLSHDEIERAIRDVEDR